MSCIVSAGEFMGEAGGLQVSASEAGSGVEGRFGGG